MTNIDEMGIKERLQYGKDKEDLVRKCLNEHYPHFNLQPASFVEDCKDKTDCWQVKGDKKSRCAIKVRATKNDILACLWEPFHGVGDPDTRRGRDMVNEYFLYITLSKNEEFIRVALGKRVHQIYNEIWDEWIAAGDIDVAKASTPKLLLCSDKHPGCQLWLHRDRHNGRPKVLGFIPPTYLKEGKEIKFYPFKK